jgi:lipoprotein NlpI
MEQMTERLMAEIRKKNGRKSKGNESRPNKNSVLTSQRTHCVSVTEMKWLTLFKEIMAVNCHNHMKHRYTAWTICTVL